MGNLMLPSRSEIREIGQEAGCVCVAVRAVASVKQHTNYMCVVSEIILHISLHISLHRLICRELLFDTCTYDKRKIATESGNGLLL